MKKNFLLLFLSLLTCTLAAKADYGNFDFGSADSGQPLYYTIVAPNQVEVVSFYSNEPNANPFIDGHVVIPSTVVDDGIEYTVTAIASGAFYGCTGLTGITIPSTVTHVGDLAFFGTPVFNDPANWSNGALYLDSCLITTDDSLPEYYVVKDGTTVIGDRAFYYQTDLKGVFLPAQLTGIGVQAFYNCNSLQFIATWRLNPDDIRIFGTTFQTLSTTDCAIIAPQSTEGYRHTTYWSDFENHHQTYSDFAAFNEDGAVIVYRFNSDKTAVYATDLHNPDAFYTGNLTIPASVNYLGVDYPVIGIYNNAFYECAGLAAVNLPDSFSEIGRSVFYKSGIYNNTSNWKDNVLYLGNYLVTSSLKSNQSSYKVKEGTTLIATDAFRWSNDLEEVSIPYSVKYLNSNAFEHCQGLETFAIDVDDPASITLGENIFLNTPVSTATLLVPKGSAALYAAAPQWQDFGTIVSTAYDFSAENSQGVTIYYNINPDGNSVSVTFKNADLSGSPYGGNLVIPSSVAYRGSDYPVTGITDRAFYGCSSLYKISIPESVTSIGYNAFEGTSIYNKEENWIDGVLYVGNYLVSTNDYLPLDGLAVREGTTVIADLAFAGQEYLRNIVLPSSLRAIGNYAFSGCTRLSEFVQVNVPDPASIALGDLVFGGVPTGSCKLFVPKYSRNSYLAADPWKSFYQVIGVTYDFYAVNPEGTNIYYNINPDGVSVSVTCHSFDPLYGRVYSGDVVIPASVSYGDKVYAVTAIDHNAFSHCHVYSVTIPDSVTTIEYEAFYECAHLNSISLPNSISSIGENAFFDTGVYNNTENWTDGVLYIGNCLIATNEDLPTSYSVAEGTYIIAAHAFGSRNQLVSITLPPSITSICSAAFYDCGSILTVNAPFLDPASVTLGENVFDDCFTDYCTLYVPKDTRDLYTAAEQWADFLYVEETFYSFSALNAQGVRIYYNVNPDGTSVSVTSKNASRNSYAGDVSVPAKAALGSTVFDVTIIGQEAFSGCTALTSVTLPNSITEFVAGAFGGSPLLTSLVIPESVNRIGNLCFSMCSGLQSIVIPDGVEILPWGVFNSCSSLESVTIPSSVTQIDVWAFADCSKLESISIPASVQDIGVNAFLRSGLYNDPANWSDGVLYIDNCLIQATESLPAGSYAVKPATRLIATCAFDGRTELTEAQLPASLSAIGQRAFRNCSALAAVNIPAAVSYIGTEAFSECSALMSVRAQSYDPESIILGDNVFQGVNVNSASPTGFGDDVCILYVPNGTLDLYDQAPQWDLFVHMEEYDSVMPGDANGDGKVTIADAVITVNALIGVAPANFVLEAADVNGDGIITISDVVAIVNIIL